MFAIIYSSIVVNFRYIFMEVWCFVVVAVGRICWLRKCCVSRPFSIREHRMANRLVCARFCCLFTRSFNFSISYLFSFMFLCGHHYWSCCCWCCSCILMSTFITSLQLLAIRTICSSIHTQKTTRDAFYKDLPSFCRYKSRVESSHWIHFYIHCHHRFICI